MKLSRVFLFRSAIVALLAAVALGTGLLPTGSADAGFTERIAFTRGSFDSSDIYVMNTDGSGQTNLTNSSAADSNPVWSPDGTKIAFTRGPFTSSDIYVMNADGSGQTNLTNSPATDLDPAWLPNSNRIVFSSNRDGSALSKYIMDADGSNQEAFSLGSPGDQSLAWSPDGSRIAFVRIDVVGTGPAPRIRPQIYVMNADGSDEIRLTPGNPDAENFNPTWSADSSRIAYASNLDFGFGMEIYVVNADGSGRIRLTDAAHLSGPNAGPDWSPDGNLFAYASFRDGVADIYVRNADGSGETNLTNNPARDSQPDWSPAPGGEVPTPTPGGPATATPTSRPPATATPTGTPGDVGCDGTVNSIDAALVLQFSAGLVGSLACQQNADVNGDGMINSIDAALILQFTAGLIPSL